MIEFSEKLMELRHHEEHFTTVLMEPWMEWVERHDVKGLRIASTSGLIRTAHQCGYEILKHYETDSLVSVVTNSSIVHSSPCLMGGEIEVRIRIDDTRENDVFFSGEFIDEKGPVATFTFVRRFISLEYLGRKLSEKA